MGEKRLWITALNIFPFSLRGMLSFWRALSSSCESEVPPSGYFPSKMKGDKDPQFLPIPPGNSSWDYSSAVLPGHVFGSILIPSSPVFISLLPYSHAAFFITYFSGAPFVIFLSLFKLFQSIASFPVPCVSVANPCGRQWDLGNQLSQGNEQPATAVAESQILEILLLTSWRTGDLTSISTIRVPLCVSLKYLLNFQQDEDFALQVEASENLATTA